MKRTIILTVLLGVLLTGCGNTEEVKAEVNEEILVEEVLVEEILIEETFVEEIEVEEIEFVENDQLYTEEYVYELRDESITDFETNWEEYGMSEECKNDIIELFMSVTYDDSFEYGYDLISLERGFMTILAKHGMVPAVCEGLSFDEINQLDDEVFEGWTM